MKTGKIIFEKTISVPVRFTCALNPNEQEKQMMVEKAKEYLTCHFESWEYFYFKCYSLNNNP